ncbi:enoyl-CoA hydratase [Bacillus sp. FJAT-50079]|uniref:enoyl-CoA hydratase n=1 Tax=Bacillus sp. FJAT-50079 TaxID=2833577 RepID=UPI001BCA5EE9|nr:enoyl-CoA hydratase [Bacillus sp. FJAT-50079]MBS4208841.1 enoyl-CoA hydratase [Bacillus sp. FJAT-50079]
MNHLMVKINEKIATVTINRPPANALSSQLITELGQLLDQLETDDQVRAILIHGEGRFFSAGADIKEFTTVTTGEEFSKLAMIGQHVFEKVESFPKPIVAAIHGAALGGGLELAMACHIRLVSETAKLGLPELQLGLIPGFAGTQRLPRLIGSAKAAELLFTSEPLTGAQAVQWGLANESYPEEVLQTKAFEMMQKIAKKSPIALKAAIDQLRYSKSDRFYEGVKEEANKFGVVFTSEDAQEGIRAFLEKREPQFKGK